MTVRRSCFSMVLSWAWGRPWKAKARENILDVASRAGVSVLWRNNNSNSKGVALRVSYENYQD